MKDDRQELRVLLWGQEIGRLFWNPATKRSYFFFSPEFLRNRKNITPITCPPGSPEERIAIYGLGEKNGDPEYKIYQGLPPFIADSLPDAWGNKIFDSWFTEHKYKEKDKTPLTKLAYIGHRAIGALEFEPVLDTDSQSNYEIDINALYIKSIEVENELKTKEKKLTPYTPIEDLSSLGTGIGGAHKKITLALSEDGRAYSGLVNNGPCLRQYILKFNNPQYTLAEIEFAYYKMATLAGIPMSPSRLIQANGINHFATERFDRKEGQKIFTQTLAAINPEANSYEDLFSTALKIGVPKYQIQSLFAQTVFNFLANNTDDHKKNFSFMLEENGTWMLTPAYDITFIISETGNKPSNTHCMSILGKYNDITESDLIDFAGKFAIKSPKRIITKVKSALKQFENIALETGINGYYSQMIHRKIAELCSFDVKRNLL